jgi:hypothetical protein
VGNGSGEHGREGWKVLSEGSGRSERRKRDATGVGVSALGWERLRWSHGRDCNISHP